MRADLLTGREGGRETAGKNKARENEREIFEKES